MSDPTIHNGVLLDANAIFTLTELCSACGVEQSLIIEMVEEGVIEPVRSSDEWCFHGRALLRAKRSLRLVQDLGINWPGAALALDLLEQLERAGAMAPEGRLDRNG